jgi:predicted ATPase/class 3 adenylate cyclase
LNARNRIEVVTILFTDIESSTHLWERDPEGMSRALAEHDALARAAVMDHHGTLVKMTGDGMHAVFADPVDALNATVDLQLSLADTAGTREGALKVRTGLHTGAVQRRENDYFGTTVNRAARIMAAAHGGQVLLSQAAAELVRDRLPPMVSLRDLGSVRLRDLTHPERIFQLVHPQVRQDFPALRSLEATPNNLPQQLTSFIGRERELIEVKELLGKTRLLTLLGVGGIGKTRLSLQLAAEVIDDFPDGVWFVELAAVADARIVAQATATVLAVKEDAGRPVSEAVMKAVGGRRMLIVLDNCEHLVFACAELARDLLQASPHLKVLASSREPLRIAGETNYSLPALAVPDAHEVVATESLMHFEAVHLFVERAVAAQPSFQVTDQNAAAVVEICRRLDGIPLAIELAAARVRALSVKEIAARLSDRFRLLVLGDRTALPRQQTLQALIDWSYDLLTEPEQALLRQLSVFSGGWTLNAAEAVCGEGANENTNVLDLLSALVEKSLVVAESERERFRLLETVRQYAQARLRESGEEAGARSRHLAFFLDLAETAKPQLVGPEQGVWLSRLDLERENLLSAHAWCDQAEGQAEQGLKLASSMRRYWIFRGLLGLGHRVTVEALQRPGAERRGLARWEALFDAGQLGSWMGRYAEAQGYLEECLAIARELGDKQRIESVLQPLGMASQGLGNADKARGHYEEALALARQLGDQRELAAALNALAQLHRAEGELDTAEPLYQNVLSLARELEDREIIAVALLNLAMVSIARGFGDRARAMLLEASAIVDEIGSKPLGQSVLEVCAGLCASGGEWERAARLYGATEAQTERTGLHRDPTDEAFLAPLISRAREALGSAAFAAAEATGRELAFETAALEARERLENRPLISADPPNQLPPRESSG